MIRMTQASPTELKTATSESDASANDELNAREDSVFTDRLEDISQQHPQAPAHRAEEQVGCLEERRATSKHLRRESCFPTVRVVDLAVPRGLRMAEPSVV